VQNIFKLGELAGKYLSDCQDYHKFFHQIATTSHHSCLILISWELPRDFVTLKSDKIKTLYLQGLTTEFEEIFKEYGLKSEEKWTKLSELYQGHPNWLNIISSTIIELFDGEVSLFLEEMKNDLFNFLIFYNINRRHGSVRKELNVKTPLNAIEKWYQLKPEIFKITPSEIWNSETYKTIRQQMLDGIQPDMCERCFKEEAAGIKSARQKYNQAGLVLRNAELDAAQQELTKANDDLKAATTPEEKDRAELNVKNKKDGVDSRKAARDAAQHQLKSI
jgi:hypothetical protein